MTEQGMDHAQVLPSQQQSEAQVADSGQAIVPYDENLLERARTQWQFGDWESLAKIDRDALQHHPDRAKLALLSAAGRLQCGTIAEAHLFLRLARDWGCGKELISRILIAGVHNSLGRAAAVAGRREQALRHFERSLTTGTPGAEARLLIQARIMHQVEQLQLPELAIHNPLLSDQAAQRRTLDVRADLRHFTTTGLASHDQSEPATTGRHACTPAPGSAGVTTKHGFLTFIHRTLQPNLYLEIGVQHGHSLALAQCEAIGIDPVPQQRVPLAAKTKVIDTTSDEFFFGMADNMLPGPPDLVLIDGMSLIEYVLRDFMNSENRAHPATLLAVTNIYPQCSEQATRRHGPDWIGDVWKLPALLATHRPDLLTLRLNVADYGLLLVAGLDPNNMILREHLVTIMQEQASPEPSSAVMNKQDALPGDHPAVSRLLTMLRQAREQSLTTAELAKQLKKINLNNLKAQHHE